MLTGVRVTNAIVIDNSPPRITIESPVSTATDATVAFTVIDAQSPIDRVEYTTDSEQWQIIYPQDGIPDSPEERFAITVSVGNIARVVVRATDSMDNTSTAGVLAVP
jgi:hypothetical protein